MCCFFQCRKRQNTGKRTLIYVYFNISDYVLPDTVDGCTVQSQPLPLTFVLSKAASCCKKARIWRQEQEQRGAKEVGSV